MYRSISLATLFALLLSAPVSAQSWTEKMFKETKHNFGTVASRADVVHKFEVKNIYKEDVELLSVSSSCGCTATSLENKNLQTWDKGYVVARFNTNTFRGQHGANLTVRIAYKTPNGARRVGTVNLRVDGNIRSDLTFTPGIASFDNVDQGTMVEKKISITYSGGRRDWKIQDVKAKKDRDFFEVELNETGRQFGRVQYDIIVRLKGNAPAGYLRDELYLITNDATMKRIPLDIEGRIKPEISVSPAQLVLGEVSKSIPITKTLVVRGKKPFKITSFECEEGCFTFKSDKESKSMHLVKVTFDACDTAEGRIKKAIQINTDRGENIAATLTAYATVVPGEESKVEIQKEETIPQGESSKDSTKKAGEETKKSETTTSTVKSVSGLVGN